MNIKRAKEQVKNAITAYFTKDDSGEYIMPTEKQRPVFLMGPPGIGKTAIMEQIASEMGVGLLSYSMTHHTRQSALGLPFIERKTYDGVEYDISEYTMSEIIASIYDLMEETGVREGILFLDEINCVSETLAPIMLQFLQYKVFGRHKVPKGWIVVTAGNPPEYNDSVREFDIVTWDRLKRIDIEPDYDVWKEYAYERGVHASILTYLEIKKVNFYNVQSTVDGKNFITARGWEDLSQMMQLYDRNKINVDEDLIVQYIQNPQISKDFAIYYDLFKKYQSDYQIEKILEGKAPEEIKSRAKEAKFDERLSLIGLLLDSVGTSVKEVVEYDYMLTELMGYLKEYKIKISSKNANHIDEMDKMIDKIINQIQSGNKSGSVSREGIDRLKTIKELMEKYKVSIGDAKDGEDAFKIIKKEFDGSVKESKTKVGKAKKVLTNMFCFLEEVFEDGQEMLIVVTELTINAITSRFISRYGCEEYFKHNKDLLFFERQKEIEAVLSELNLD